MFITCIHQKITSNNTNIIKENGKYESQNGCVVVNDGVRVGVWGLSVADTQPREEGLKPSPNFFFKILYFKFF